MVRYIEITINAIQVEVEIEVESGNDLIFLKHQGGNSLEPSQYRPMTVPSNLLRLITVRMCDLMTTAAEENHLLGEEQFGFRKGRSTLDAAFVLTTLLKKAKNKR